MRITCRQASQLLSEGQERSLSFGERLKLRIHLAICDACTNFAQQLALVRRAVRGLKERSGPDPRS